MSDHTLPGAGERLQRGLLAENPVLVQLLGMCPSLAVTNNLAGALMLGATTAVVLLLSNVVVASLRRWLRPHLRILIYTVTIAICVTVADRVLAAFWPQLSRRLGPYVPLIIVNCILISRAEVCAAKQSPWVAACDAIGQGGGFVLGLALLASLRELAGAGTLLGAAVLPAAWPRLPLLLLPAGAFLTLGLLIAARQALQQRAERSRG